MGPIPWTWVVSAARLPGHALALGTAIWHVAFRRRTARVSISISRMSTLFEVDRATISRGLAALEKIGLVRVLRRPGRKPDVELLRAPLDPKALNGV